jgi:hypothetical protein
MSLEQPHLWKLATTFPTISYHTVQYMLQCNYYIIPGAITFYTMSYHNLIMRYHFSYNKLPYLPYWVVTVSTMSYYILHNELPHLRWSTLFALLSSEQPTYFPHWATPSYSSALIKAVYQFWIALAKQSLFCWIFIHIQHYKKTFGVISSYILVTMGDGCYSFWWQKVFITGNMQPAPIVTAYLTKFANLFLTVCFGQNVQYQTLSFV